MNVADWIQALPKAELHVHLEGTLEPALLLAIAQRNGITVPYASVEQLRAAYQFGNLQDFLDLYYAGTQVLRTEADFFDLTWAYLERARSQTIRHVEVFCDPQAHSDRGVPLDAVFGGIQRALRQAAAQWGLSWRLIPCFLRHLGPAAAIAAWEQWQPYRDAFTAVGLDSSEQGHPPAPFQPVFEQVRSAGLHTVAHAGEEGPAAYIWDALRVLQVSRIDHGVRCEEDPALVAHLAQTRMPLTVCPLSNVKLCVFERLADHNLRRLLQAGLCITLNSDDPAYFGGYLSENFQAAYASLNLTVAEVLQLACNSFEAAFVPDALRQRWIQEVQIYGRSLTVSCPDSDREQPVNRDQ
jgi:adenosine deaminase